MFRGDGDVRGARVLERLHPLVRIEAHRVEEFGQPFVARDRNAFALHDPFGEAVLFTAAGHQAVQTPVDENAETAALEVFAGAQVFGRRSVDGGRGVARVDGG